MPVNEVWEKELKPKILSYRRVPLELAAEVLGCKTRGSVEEMLRSGLYSFGKARKNPGGKYSYEIFPLRFIAWYEGKLP